MQLQPVPAQHRQTNYIPSPLLDPPVVLLLPSWTSDIDEAKSHLSEYGMCVLTDVLASDEIDQLRHALERQSDAERLLDSQAPPGANSIRQSISNLVNKGKVFLDLVEHSVSDNLAGFLLGKSFLLSSVTGNLCRAPVAEPQPLHRDQGYVPATVDFPAACNLLWCLDDFCPENGGTCVVPGKSSLARRFPSQTSSPRAFSSNHRTGWKRIRLGWSSMARLWPQRDWRTEKSCYHLLLPALGATTRELGNLLPAGSTG